MDDNQRFSLRGKTVLLTGGAGKYGAALTQALAESGATLIVASRNQEALHATVERFKGAVTVAPLDQADEQSILALRDLIVGQFGSLDGLVNNAVSRPVKGLHGSADSWDESMAVNSRGVMLMHRHFGEMMASQTTGGSIVNIGSIYGMTGPTTSLYTDPEPNLVPDYYFHKAGLINLSRFYAGVYGRQKVRVNCISAGGLLAGQDPGFVERYGSHTFLGRMASGEELAGPVIFLLSTAASYITGENLVVDGGFTAH